jgi:hypothetical protein
MRNEKEQRVRDYNDSIKRTKSQTMTKIVQSIEQISLFVEINESKKNLCVFVLWEKTMRELRISAILFCTLQNYTFLRFAENINNGVCEML